MNSCSAQSASNARGYANREGNRHEEPRQESNHRHLRILTSGSSFQGRGRETDAPVARQRRSNCTFVYMREMVLTAKREKWSAIASGRKVGMSVAVMSPLELRCFVVNSVAKNGV